MILPSLYSKHPQIRTCGLRTYWQKFATLRKVISKNTRTCFAKQDIWVVMIMAQSIPSVLNPPAFFGHLSSRRSRRCGICQKISARGWGICQFFKNMPLESFSYFYKEFSMIMLLRDMCGFRSITYLSQSNFLHPSKKLLNVIVISSHMEEKQSMYRLKSLMKKTLSLCVNG